MESIELAYRWIGIGNQVQNFQRIIRSVDGFFRGGVEIPPQDVERLIESVSHLRPEPFMLSATTHTDDYPSWTVELTGADGNSILLYSESNAPNYIPWNVVYNGAYYAQFDGQIAMALNDLFEVVEGETLASVWGPDSEDGYLTVTPIENPKTLSHGFRGLLPLNHDFSYNANAQKGELRGILSGFNWSSEVEGVKVGWLSDIKKIELVLEDGQSIACPVETIPGNDPEFSGLYFTCPVGEREASSAFSYIIRLTYANPEGQTYAREGKLFGYWEPVTVLPVFSLPQEIGAILENSPASEDFLEDHPLELLNMVAKFDPETGLLDHRWEADIALLGQAQVGERLLPYSITLHQVRIEDGKLTHWDIDRQELQALIEDVLAEPITRRFMEGEQNLILNLFYVEESSYAIISDEHYNPCAGLTSAGDLPSPGKPVRCFSFNSSLETWAMQLFFNDEKIRINYLYVDLSSPEGAIWASLLPPELQPVGAPLYQRIRNTYGSTGVEVGWDKGSSDADIRIYKSLLESRGVDTFEHTYDPAITFLGVSLDITPDGRLTLVDCLAP